MKLQNESIPYTHAQLFGKGHPIVYSGRQLENIAFPLGGIGTGTISLGGWGQLRDFEIFNRPAKGQRLDYTFFTLCARQARHQPVTKVLQGPVASSDLIQNGHGYNRGDGSGLPHFRGVTFTGRFPFARLDFTDDTMPLQVAMEAWNPFIPLNADDSGLPVAMFQFHLTNPTTDSVKATLYANLPNRIGLPDDGGGRIEVLDTSKVRGLIYSNGKYPKKSPRHGTMALVTPHKAVTCQTHWYRGRWFDSLHDFWDHACEGDLPPRTEPAEIGDQGYDVGSIALKVTLKPGESRTLPVWIIWHYPNFEKYWHQGETKPVWKNYYAKLHEDAAAVAAYLGAEHVRLERETRLFADALFASTLPAPVMDAVSSQISILKSTTCLRLQDGTFYAFEGCSDKGGCCEGTCTHVWNYAQALPYLFPALARSVRDADYAFNIHRDGHMTFRMPLPIKTKADESFHAAADGQMGGIMKVYREWLVSGDDAWLRKLWPRVKRALEYAWVVWDRDRDGIMEGIQHNTYDIEFHGPNSMMGTFYLGALRAGEEMARHLGDDASADEYHRLYEQGRAYHDACLFNGEYYFQEVRPGQYASGQRGCHGAGSPGTDTKFADWPKYQYGKGCLADQLIGQWYARMLHLGELVDEDHLRSAIASVFKYNWKGSLLDHANPQRIYAVNDEGGLLLCTWPRGERPGLPFVYSDEVWCGIEYQVASHLIYEGFVEEGLAIVKGVRDRHDGTRRNPWNEFECGHHYARSLASYSLLLALADFLYSAPSQSLSVAPRVYQKDFACFFSVDSGWGMVRQSQDDEGKRLQVKILYGSLVLRNLQSSLRGDDFIVRLDDRIVPAEGYPSSLGLMVNLLETTTLRPGHTLTLSIV